MKYCKEITNEICEQLKGGMTRTDTCEFIGIAYETFCQWMKKPEFSEAIKKAEQKCKGRNIGIIQKAALTTWQAAAWWLERKHKDEYSSKQNLEHSGQVSVNLSDAVKKERASRGLEK